METVFDNEGSVYSEMGIKKYNSDNKSYELNDTSSIVEIILDNENVPELLKGIIYGAIVSGAVEMMGSVAPAFLSGF
jgi:hypothetical protein